MWRKFGQKMKILCIEFGGETQLSFGDSLLKIEVEYQLLSKKGPIFGSLVPEKSSLMGPFTQKNK